MTEKTEDDLRMLADMISTQISVIRGAPVTVYVSRPGTEMRTLHLGRWGSCVIVSGANSDMLYECGKAYLDGLRFE